MKHFRGGGRLQHCYPLLTEVLEYFESKARPLKEGITVPSVFCKNKLLDNLEEEGVSGEGAPLMVV
jgi:hypothetical protein